MTFVHRLLSHHIRAHLLNPALLPPLLRTLREALFPNNAPAPPRVAPSPEEELAIKCRAAQAVLAATPAAMGRSLSRRRATVPVEAPTGLAVKCAPSCPERGGKPLSLYDADRLAHLGLRSRLLRAVLPRRSAALQSEAPSPPIGSTGRCAPSSNPERNGNALNDCDVVRIRRPGTPGQR